MFLKIEYVYNFQAYPYLKQNIVQGLQICSYLQSSWIAVLYPTQSDVYFQIQLKIQWAKWSVLHF